MEWSVASVVRRRVDTQGDDVMIEFGDRRITWREMDERSSQVAQALREAGVGPADRIAFLDKNGPEYFETLFGAGKLNAVDVAVNWRLAPPEIVYTVNDAEARVLIVGPDFVDTIAGIESDLETVKTIVVIGEDPRYRSYEAWIAEHEPVDPMVPTAPDDVAMQLYTSGTTGLPKGAMLTNINLGTLMDYVAAEWLLDEQSVSIVVMPLFHIGGSGWALVGMWAGCRSILHREFVPQEVLSDLTERKVTNALFVPAMLQFLCSVPGAGDGDYTELRRIVYGAAPITNEALLAAMRTFRCEFTQVYGLTETTGAITQLAPGDHDPGGPREHLLRSAGRPFEWVDLRIVDPDTEEDRKAGEVGEVWIRSIQNMAGYWKRPEESAQVLVAEGWFRSGDAGYLDEDGFLFLTDRVKDMIVSGGENVYPAEIENALADHPDIGDIAVIGVPHEKWGETVKAVVVLRPGAAADAGSIMDHARARLAGFKCPTSVEFVAELPRNPSGKILKRELREPSWKGQERRIN